MVNSPHEEFGRLTRALVAQGEDRDEMEYWADIFPDLPEEKQNEMLELFRKELGELKSQTQ